LSPSASFAQLAAALRKHPQSPRSTATGLRSRLITGKNNFELIRTSYRPLLDLLTNKQNDGRSGIHKFNFLGHYAGSILSVGDNSSKATPQAMRQRGLANPEC